MKLKLIAIAALVVSASAYADRTFDFGTVSGTVPIGNGFPLSGSFTDTFNFDVSAPSSGSAVAVNTGYTFPMPPFIFSSLSYIAGFTGKLDGNALALTPTIQAVGNGVDQVMQTIRISSLPLAAGAHMLVISGTADSGAAYTGSITISAVPEPETYALMLAGLVAIGFLARRRRDR